MFSFRRKTREEITAETFDARFQVRTTGKGALDRWLPDILLAQAPQEVGAVLGPDRLLAQHVRGRGAVGGAGVAQ